MWRNLPRRFELHPRLEGTCSPGAKVYPQVRLPHHRNRSRNRVLSLIEYDYDDEYEGDVGKGKPLGEG